MSKPRSLLKPEQTEELQQNASEGAFSALKNTSHLLKQALDEFEQIPEEELNRDDPTAEKRKEILAKIKELVEDLS